MTVRWFYLQFASISVHVEKVDETELIEGTSELYTCGFKSKKAVGLHEQSLVGADAPSKSQQVCVLQP